MAIRSPASMSLIARMVLTAARRAEALPEAAATGWRFEAAATGWRFFRLDRCVSMYEMPGRLMCPPLFALRKPASKSFVLISL